MDPAVSTHPAISPTEIRFNAFMVFLSLNLSGARSLFSIFQYNNTTRPPFVTPRFGRK
jgi:hypothetical protein